jgi:hypothetical protein
MCISMDILQALVSRHKTVHQKACQKHFMLTLVLFIDLILWPGTPPRNDSNTLIQMQISERLMHRQRAVGDIMQRYIMRHYKYSSDEKAAPQELILFSL